jgi:hypothetical protein
VNPCTRDKNRVLPVDYVTFTHQWGHIQPRIFSEKEAAFNIIRNLRTIARLFLSKVIPSSKLPCKGKIWIVPLQNGQQFIPGSDPMDEFSEKAKK